MPRQAAAPKGGLDVGTRLPAPWDQGREGGMRKGIGVWLLQACRRNRIRAGRRGQKRGHSMFLVPTRIGPIPQIAPIGRPMLLAAFREISFPSSRFAFETAFVF